MYKVEFKSKPLGCLAYPYEKVYVTNGENNEEIERQIKEDLNEVCPHCHKTWKEHLKAE